MKKLLLGTAAVALGLSLASPAQAQVQLDVGGYFKGYLSWLDQDETDDDPATAAADESESVRSFDILRDTEVHFTGEYTLDNGLTVGFHTELEDDHGDNFTTQETYAYFSGAWGRVNLGAEDGAAYLLQVAAPSADSNLDGLRQWVQPVDYDRLNDSSAPVLDTITIDDIFNGFGAFGAVDAIVHDRDDDGAVSAGDVLLGSTAVIGTAPGFFPTYSSGALADAFDYDQAVSAFDDKITYLSPVFNGFQLGASYTPELDATSNSLGGHTDDTNSEDGGLDEGYNEYGDVFDIAARWEGMFGDVGITLGAGYSHADHEANDAAEVANGSMFYRDVNGNGDFDAGVDEQIGFLGDREAWNAGLDLNWGAFGLGGAYTNDDLGVTDDALERENWVVGVDYTTGPFKLGATYYDQHQSFATAELNTERWTGGVVYTYGPGMTFRGSVSYIDHTDNLGDEGVGNADDENADAIGFLLGTQIDF